MMSSSIARPAGGHGFNFVTWNCKGINNPVNRSKVLHYLRQLRAHIIFLQETHLKVSQHSNLRCRWVNQVFHSSFQSKARGVAILIHKSVPFTCSNIIADPNGRYVIVSGRLSSRNVLLANIYAPNWDSSDFFRSVFSTLPDVASHMVILGGDFNCWLNPHLDRSSTKLANLSTSAKVIHSFMSDFAVSDTWRAFNPTQKAYSFFSPVHHTYTCIDYFLVDNRLLHSIASCKYNPIVISDHAPLTMEIVFQNIDNLKPLWQLNTNLLSSENLLVLFRTKLISLWIETDPRTFPHLPCGKH